MSDKHLLLPSAKMGVPVTSTTRRVGEWIFIALGAAAVLYGLVNVLSRISDRLDLDSSVVQTAFAPLGTLGTNSILPQTATSTTPIIPTRIVISSIGVNAAVERVGKKADGSMATPSSFETTGWYELGAKPGEAGNAVIDGHVNNALTKAGVFEHLSDVKIGDTIAVSDASGRTLTFVVSETDQYNTESAPAAEIFTASGTSQLVLITCDGQWDAAAHSYDKRFVVYAKLTTR
ncbi:MAG TPA: class F sortase [Candidatus Paceibacterota bacterium]|nr:class F sortase [Candidatus Paceibacterota bacterium]